MMRRDSGAGALAWRSSVRAGGGRVLGRGRTAQNRLQVNTTEPHDWPPGSQCKCHDPLPFGSCPTTPAVLVGWVRRPNEMVSSRRCGLLCSPYSSTEKGDCQGDFYPILQSLPDTTGCSQRPRNPRLGKTSDFGEAPGSGWIGPSVTLVLFPALLVLTGRG